MASNPFDPELQMLRKLVLTPCSSREGLARWCRYYLKLDFPDQRIDDSSTGSVIDTMWEIYDAGVNNRPLKMENGEDARRALLYASRDSFKCVERGTWILTRDRGLQVIESVLVGDMVWSGKAWRRVTDWIHDGEKEGVRLELEDGHRLVTSPVHRVWTWSVGGLPTWKAVSGLDVSSDLVMVDAPECRDVEVECDDYRDGYILGVLAGDGCLTLMDKYSRVCVSASDEFVLSAWVDFCVKTCGRAPKKNASRPYDYWIHSVEVCKKLKSFGYLAKYSYEKTVPHRAVSSPSAMSGFISGLLDTDGSIQKNSVIVSLTSLDLLLGVQMMLNALGVHSYIRSNAKMYGKQRHMVHHLVIKAREFPQMERVGIRISAKKAQVARLRQAKKKDTHDGIPYSFVVPLLDTLPKDGGRWKKSKALKPKISSQYPTVCREKLSALLDWAEEHRYLDEATLSSWRYIAGHRWVRPVKVERCSADFFDFTVEEDHSYWSNGIVSHNTLGGAVLELLAMLHMNRSVIHLAAIEQQAAKAQEYLRAFLEREFLDEFGVGNNKRTVAVLWFEHKDSGDILTNDEWKALEGRAGRHQYIRHVFYTKVIVNTPQSSNSDHVSFMLVDEADLIRYPKAYDEAKLIPSTQTDVYGQKQPPITVITSTRKSGGGLVQKEIDEAHKTRTLVRHWGILDVTARCPEDRHRPATTEKVWYSDTTLRTYTQEEFLDLSTRDPKAAAKCAEKEAYGGCAKCSIFAACQGRLAAQKSQAGLLKEITDTIGKFHEVDADMAQAQLLCRKPGNQGAVYPHFSRDTHMLSADEMWAAITGAPAPFGCNKDMLIQLLVSRGSPASTGLDFGFTHCFACITGWTEGHRFFILDSFEIPGLEPSQCVDICNTRIKQWNPTVWPDTAYPAYIKMFRSNGYRMHTHKKDVIGGIESIRSKLMPVGSREPEIFLLRGDEGCEHLAKRIAGYKWKVDQAGEPTDIPDDRDDDLCDALRYVIQNTFQRSGKVVTASKAYEARATSSNSAAAALQPYTPEGWAKQKIQELTGGQGAYGEATENPVAKIVKKGIFTVDFT